MYHASSSGCTFARTSRLERVIPSGAAAQRADRAFFGLVDLSPQRGGERFPLRRQRADGGDRLELRIPGDGDADLRKGQLERRNGRQHRRPIGAEAKLPARPDPHHHRRLQRDVAWRSRHRAARDSRGPALPHPTTSAGTDARLTGRSGAPGPPISSGHGVDHFRPSNAANGRSKPSLRTTAKTR